MKKMVKLILVNTELMNILSVYVKYFTDLSKYKTHFIFTLNSICVIIKQVKEGL